MSRSNVGQSVLGGVGTLTSTVIAFQQKRALAQRTQVAKEAEARAKEQSRAVSQHKAGEPYREADVRGGIGGEFLREALGPERTEVEIAELHEKYGAKAPEVIADLDRVKMAIAEQTSSLRVRDLHKHMKNDPDIIKQFHDSYNLMRSEGSDMMAAREAAAEQAWIGMQERDRAAQLASEARPIGESMVQSIMDERLGTFQQFEAAFNDVNQTPAGPPFDSSDLGGEQK